MPKKLVMKMSKAGPEEGEDPELPAGEQNELSMEEFRQLPVITCAQPNCGVVGNKLRLCSRCKAVRYCSTPCQKADWAKHKPQCELFVKMKEINYGSAALTQKETKLQSNLRNFTARFEISLMAALICALDLRNKPENISNLAVLVTIVPQRRSKTACFVFKDVEVLPISVFATLIGNMEQVLEMHKTKREELQRESGGDRDYGTLAVFASNTGPGRLEGDLDGEYRFKPLAISWKMVRSSFYADPTMDWRASLKIQIDKDLPNRPV